MTIRCPKCRKSLPGCGKTANAGDAIECGLCGHVWTRSTTNAFCLCGNPAFKRSSCGPVCERCSELEHVTSQNLNKYHDAAVNKTVFHPSPSPFLEAFKMAASGQRLAKLGI